MLRDYEKIINLFYDLWDSNDPDCARVDEYDGLKEHICDLFTDCYSYADFCEWLAEHDNCPAADFRFASIITLDDFRADYLRNTADSVDGWDEMSDDERDELVESSFTEWAVDNCILYYGGDDYAVESW